MADDYGKQGVRTLDGGDVKVGIYKSDNSTQIDPLADGTFTGRIGEVQSSPTQYTVLERLKVINTTLTTIANTLGGSGTAYALYHLDTLAGGGGSTNWDALTASADTYIRDVVCTSSAYSTYAIQIDPTGSSGFTTHWYGMVSESSPCVVVPCDSFKVASGGKIRIIKTNKDPNSGKSVDLHTTINVNY